MRSGRSRDTTCRTMYRTCNARTKEMQSAPGCVEHAGYGYKTALHGAKKHERGAGHTNCCAWALRGCPAAFVFPRAATRWGEQAFVKAAGLRLQQEQIKGKGGAARLRQNALARGSRRRFQMAALKPKVGGSANEGGEAIRAARV